ncbi:MAG: zf-TFIIB domain-containing protein [Pseudomonadales bacterium]|nr:zf-TFIIB domain-containing protein [Pseudomonadales bacterium]MDP7360452.1 zf-TFIIB domain-containing protein [Pseudomonadales bacterium]MDP7597157.1 zf-TFIIB domain-containing protein [Pseudomonadales bacterium]HJN48990.1 zf-TFIIB domain-containing protein [Pseudomonadales bacterium]
MICPKCAAEMLVLTVGTLRGKVVVDRCSNCSGIWFDHGEAEALKEKWGSEYIDCGDPKVGRLYNTLRDIRCPICKDKMDQCSDERQPHIRYEVCGKDGMFLDAGEFTDYANETLVDLFRGFYAQIQDRLINRSESHRL